MGYPSPAVNKQVLIIQRAKAVFQFDRTSCVHGSLLGRGLRVQVFIPRPDPQTLQDTFQRSIAGATEDDSSR